MENKISEFIELSISYAQDKDCNDLGDDIQELKLSIDNWGGPNDDYFVLESKRWAFDKIEDLIEILENFKKKHESIKK